MSSMPNPSQLISFIVPLMNEEDTLVELYDGVAKHVPADSQFEVIFVDDGSSDNSWQIVQSLVEVYRDNVRGIRFRANRGKAAALTAGYRAARGSIVFTMDADLQDDPKEIPRFLDELARGFDLVSGWKKKRHDPWHKVLPSRIFNWMLSRVSGVKLHDHNCGFKCYRKELVDELTLYGELHRMVPSLAKMKGFRCSEIVVDHHARQFGKSKYGIERFLRGFSDMLTVGFQRRFGERPSHPINGIGVTILAVAVSLIGIGFLSGVTRIQGLLCVLFGLVVGCMGIATFLVGQIGEMIIRGGLSSQKLPVVEDIGLDQFSKQPISLSYVEIGKKATSERILEKSEIGSEPCHTDRVSN